MSETRTETKEERRTRKINRKERKERLEAKEATANGTVDPIVEPSEKMKKKKKEKSRENDDVMTTLDEALSADTPKNEKSEKKSKKRSKEDVTAAEVEAVLADARAEENGEHKSKEERKKKSREQDTSMPDADKAEEQKASKKKDKKRKREQDANGNELEIDVSLPEPPSKKALRRMKKGKARLPSVNDDSTPKRKEKPESYLDDGEEAKEQVEGTRKSERIASQPKNRSEFGVWIGNLNWSMTREGLINFLTTNSTVTTEDIVRLHMPKPKENDTVAARMRIKPENSGYAYVDLPNIECVEAIIALSETDINGRKVLIKNSKSFEGRPEKRAEEPVRNTKPPSKRVFIGNLGFDVTKDEVETLYAPCGNIEHVFLATFEDSGKCKGFGWVTFDSIEAASQAVQGFTIKAPEVDDEDEEQEGETKRKPKKGRKWFVNQLNGRKVKCEFAEDASVRYKKRFGKDKPREEEDKPLEIYE